jgi:NADH:ubiquinone oxidoreductase subunit K
MLAVAALVAAGALWPRADGAVFAGLCVAMASSAMATGFALLEPLWPRAIWGLAIAAPVVAGLLAASAL